MTTSEQNLTRETRRPARARRGVAVCLSSLAAAPYAAGPAAGAQAASAEPLVVPSGDSGAEVPRRIHFDYVDEAGRLRGGSLVASLPEHPERAAASPAAWTTLRAAPEQQGGPQGNPAPSGAVGARLDLVFVGDGYRANQLDTYAQRVDEIVDGLFAIEPYRTYASYFSAHRVDVVSNESGVDHAPTYGIWKDTALDMTYWYQGVERSLFVDPSKAWSYANNVPGADMVVAVARNSLYGGLSLSGLDVVTVAGGNAGAPLILQHELGHGLGRLADEYFDLDGSTYTGAFEFGEPNLSRQSEFEMAATGSKWAAWLGEDDAESDGLVSTFEGAGLYQFGVFRPTAHSIMRTLGSRFNPPSREALVVELYKRVNPIDVTIDPNVFYDEGATLWVTPMRPLGHELLMRWTLDGAPIPGANGETLALCGLAMSAGWHAVGVEVTDPTPWVRDEAARAAHLTQSVYFVVNSGGSEGATSYCSAAPNSVGEGAHLQPLGTSSLAANDFGVALVGAPASQPGLLFLGASALQTPFGDGFLCVGGGLVRFPVQALGADGSLRLTIDWQALPAGAHVDAGELRRFQFWYRDPIGPGGSGFNLSDALAVRLCP